MLYTGYNVVSLVLLILSAVIVVQCQRNEDGDICNRIPKDTRASKTPGDNGFRIKLVGRPPPEKYVPNQVYTISINGTYADQKIRGFSLVAVPLNAQDETTAMGTFQHINSGITRFHAQCPHIVTHTYQDHPKAGVEVLWTAPAEGSGCVELRATIVELPDIWYKDDGALTRVFCEDTGVTESNKPLDLIPECCACGSAKYMVTFHGLWSRQSHPKEYPERKRLLHWSNIVGASHSNKYSVWKYGDFSSTGVKEVCEFGYSRKLEEEMRKHSYDVRTVIKTSGIWWSDPEGLRQSRSARFSVDKTKHFVSILSMLGPSPDWCVGVSAMDLCLSNCTWLGDMSIDLYPWDAGTDDGISYVSPNSPSRPRQKIHKITSSYPKNPNSPFFGTNLEPMARLEIKRVSPKPGDPETCNEEDEVDEEESGFGGGDGDLSDMEMKKKLMMMQSGKCAVADWLDWTDCSVTCGVGMRIRKRMFQNPMVDENMCPGIDMMEKENCIGVENTCEDPDAVCSATEWSEWSPCSVSCGKGIQERRRYYMRKISAETCSREMSEVQMCLADMVDCMKAEMMKNFTVICSEERDAGRCRGSFTRWYFDTQMQKCLPFTYGGCRGNNNRFMTMEECQSTCGDASSRNQEEDSHRGNPSAKERGIPCMVTPWSDWSECSSTCGKSFKYKHRMIKREPENGGKACPNKMKKRGKCDVPACEGQEVVDCMMSEWTEWSVCSATCGEAVKSRRRMIKREPENGGKKCSKKIHRERPCKVVACTANEQAAPPSERGVIEEPRFGEVRLEPERPEIPQNPVIEERRHHTHQSVVPVHRLSSVPRPCEMGQWSDWSPCPPYSCVQERTRPVSRREDHGGETCGARLQRRHCSHDQCYRRARVPRS